MDPKLKQDRLDRILLLRGYGVSFAHIGREFGISRERVRQIYNQYQDDAITIKKSDDGGDVS